MSKNVSLLPDLRNVSGGPAMFQRKLSQELTKRNVVVKFNQILPATDVVLLINGIRQFGTLILAKCRHTRIIQRLGLPLASSMQLSLSFSQRLRAWIGNQNMVLSKRIIADRIVYQSRFVRDCWEREYGPEKKPSMIIYNGVDLSLFSTDGPKYNSSADICIISVEGTQICPEDNLAFLVTEEIRRRGSDVELLVFGNPWADARLKFSEHSFVRFMGMINNTELSYYYRGASCFVSNDVIAACPNAVIEAFACGTPVIGYEFGVLPELVSQEGGRLVPIACDPRKGVIQGNVRALADSVLEVVEKNSAFRKGARKLAEERYGLDHMGDQYMKILFD